MKTFSKINVGDKFLRISNVEDILSYIIIYVSDIYEIGYNENVYVFDVFKIKTEKQENFCKILN